MKPGGSGPPLVRSTSEILDALFASQSVDPVPTLAGPAGNGAVPVTATSTRRRRGGGNGSGGGSSASSDGEGGDSGRARSGAAKSASGGGGEAPPAVNPNPNQPNRTPNPNVTVGAVAATIGMDPVAQVESVATVVATYDDQATLVDTRPLERAFPHKTPAAPPAPTAGARAGGKGHLVPGNPPARLLDSVDVQVSPAEAPLPSRARSRRDVGENRLRRSHATPPVGATHGFGEGGVGAPGATTTTRAVGAGVGAGAGEGTSDVVDGGTKGPALAPRVAPFGPVANVLPPSGLAAAACARPVALRPAGDKCGPAVAPAPAPISAPAPAPAAVSTSKGGKPQPYIRDFDDSHPETDPDWVKPAGRYTHRAKGSDTSPTKRRRPEDKEERLPWEVSLEEEDGEGEQPGPGPVTRHDSDQIQYWTDQLAHKSVEELKRLLKANRQMVSGNKPDLIHRVATGAALGAMPKCTRCTNDAWLRYDASKKMYYCPGGYLGTCGFSTPTVHRHPWVWK